MGVGLRSGEHIDPLWNPLENSVRLAADANRSRGAEPKGHALRRFPPRNTLPANQGFIAFAREPPRSRDV